MFQKLIDRIFGRKAPSGDAPTAPAYTPEQVQGWLVDQLRCDVASGFLTQEQILKGAEDSFERELPDGDARRLAEEMLPQMLAEHRAAQADWPERTDCDRLDEAFAALETSGIVSRQNFSCCGTCGSAEIWDELMDVQAAGGPATGYAFYHVQDTESAVQGDGLYLNYGACDEGEDAALRVASQIVETLEAHGLTTSWNGSWEQRIGVALDWKRRNEAEPTIH